MKYFIWQYNPDIVGIRSCKNITFIVPKNRKKQYIQKNIESIITVDLCDFKNTYLAIKNQRKQGINIEDIFSLDEEMMDWIGVLKSIFVSSRSGVSDILFKDKYYMRSIVNNVVPEPNFFELTSENYHDINISEGMIKPRRADSTKGIKYFDRPLEISQLKNKNGYFSDKDLLVEEFVHYDKMFTVDGYTDFNGHERFFSHEYNNKLSDYKENGFFTLHTSSLYYDNNALLNRLFVLTKQALRALAIEKEITPFHFEWFYSSQTNSFIFTEAGKRFGGAKIPLLIKNSFNIDILDEYWKLQEGDISSITYNDSHNFPSCCTTSYIQLENGKIMTKRLDDKIDNLLLYSQSIPVGEKTKNAASIGDAVFSAQYYNNTVVESDYMAQHINLSFKKVCR